ncbi:MAG: winged helix-turn-helix domain-containing protein [Oligoflexia bacterium]|nr:winged helix-turn-helix domain-containing protein [Oligoflexia bacterium]
MSRSVLTFLCSQPVMQLIRGLINATRPRHLRELAYQHSLSPSGVSDIIRRLRKAGILNEIRQGNRRCFSLRLPPTELDCLRTFFRTFENAMIEQRSARFSANAAKKLEWMDEAYKFYRGVRKIHHDSA